MLAVAVPGLTSHTSDKEELSLSARRAQAIATVIEDQGIRAVAAPADGAAIQLEPATDR
jgi:outer membrane protein OmpA-like peptidoglycan-associated protein